MLASLRKRDPGARPRALLGATREPDGFEGGRLHPLQEAPEAFSRPQRDQGVVQSVEDALGEGCAHPCGVQAPVPPATAAHGCLAQRLAAPLWEEAVSWAEASSSSDCGARLLGSTLVGAALGGSCVVSRSGAPAQSCGSAARNACTKPSRSRSLVWQTCRGRVWFSTAPCFGAALA